MPATPISEKRAAVDRSLHPGDTFAGHYKGQTFVATVGADSKSVSVGLHPDGVLVEYKSLCGAMNALSTSRDTWLFWQRFSGDVPGPARTVKAEAAPPIDPPKPVKVAKAPKAAPAELSARLRVPKGTPVTKAAQTKRAPKAKPEAVPA